MTRDQPHDNQLRLNDILIGEIDAKNEIIKQAEIDGAVFHNGFFIPPNYDAAAIDSGATMFIVGFKGTGKTSLLRWMANRRTKDGNYSHFLLFKSELLEEDRQAMSRGVWFEVLPIRKDLSGIEQDFKYAWSWILIERLFDAFLKDRNACIRDEQFTNCAQVIGYDIGAGRSVLTRQYGSLMPRLDGGNVEIQFPAASAGGLAPRSTERDRILVPFGDLVRAARAAISKITYTGKKVFLFIDELEAFSTFKENYDRDIRMIRDLLFAVYDLNVLFREKRIPVYIVASVRSEILSIVNKYGEEVGRNVQDFSMKIDWSKGRRSPEHLLIKLIEQKIKGSEIHRWGYQKNFEPIKTYFPTKVGGMPVYAYLLDQSMYRPRDVVRRLGIVRRDTPNAWVFSDDALRTSVGEYSRQMWQEAREELVASYASDEVSGLEEAFVGFTRYFHLRQFEDRLRETARRNDSLRQLLDRHSPQQVLQDFFRLGVVGNHIRAGNANRTEIRTRWAFRGDTTLALDRRMAFHQSLWPNFSLLEAGMSDNVGSLRPRKPKKDHPKGAR
ncbi:hypothetical protein [Phenylobacterium sp.]|uniref:P-loop ATPase, Sll1717 family n=1 Tax=Phenylobacterium sp. TaxID=1871053 RepID=UPI00301DE205